MVYTLYMQEIAILQDKLVGLLDINKMDLTMCAIVQANSDKVVLYT